ncbi:hypothetical protein WEH80_25365 [Actinomycetes bacterium KLBMP 9759]
MRARRMLTAGAIAAVAVIGPVAAAAPASAAPVIAAPTAVSAGYYATKANCDNMGAWLKKQYGYSYWFCNWEGLHDPPWHLFMQ